MSDVKKNLLDDDELEKIGGGIKYAIYSLDNGDVFVDKNNPNIAFVIMGDIAITDDDTEVSFVDAFKSELGWKKVDMYTMNLYLGF